MGNIPNVIKNEFKVDTWYHIVLTIVVIIKIIFIISAIIVFEETRNHHENTPFFKRIVRIKDISNELAIIIICILMIHVFNPFNNNYTVDKHLKNILFVFAILTLCERHWFVFTGKNIQLINHIQFFTGRIGTLQDQTSSDKRHLMDYH